MMKDRMPPRVFVLTGALFLLGSCSTQEAPKDILDQVTFAKAYCALEEASRNSVQADRNSVRGFDSQTTLSRIGVSREQFERTVRYHQQNLELWRAFYSEVVALQEGTQKKIKTQSP